jgi:hypothetical protein
MFHLYGDVTIAGEELQNLGLWLVLRAFKQEGMFIKPRLLWHGTSIFPVSPERPSHSVAITTNMGKWRTYSNPDPHEVQLDDMSLIMTLQYISAPRQTVNS